MVEVPCPNAEVEAWVRIFITVAESAQSKGCELLACRPCEETLGWAGAALTKPCRVRTAGCSVRGERAVEVCARNRCHHLS